MDIIYERDIPKLPNEICRDEFVNEIFNLGLNYECGYNVLISAVEIGDKFVSYNKKRRPHTLHNRKFSKGPIKILVDLVPQIYSKELAHVVFAISCNSIEDWGYSIDNVASQLDNVYVYKMEWEVCMVINFHVPYENFFIHMLSLIDNPNNISAMFWDLTRQICMDKLLLYSNRASIIVAIILLIKNKKLRAERTYRERIFTQTIILTSNEYEIPLNILLKSLIDYKLTNSK